MKRTLTKSIFFTLIALLFQSAEAREYSSANVKSSLLTAPVRFMATWSPDSHDNTDSLKAKIVDDAPHHFGILCVFRKKKGIFSFNPVDLYPCAMFELQDGNLATEWTTGLGNYNHLFVFAYSKGAVHEVLHTVSDGMLPEFAYQQTGHLMGSSAEDKNGNRKLLGGPFFEQRIIIPNTKWTELKQPYLGTNRDKQPISADIYTWDEKVGKYRVRRNVPWGKRLQRL